MLQRIITVGCTLLLGAALAACAVTTSEARAAFCASLGTLEQAMASYEALGPNGWRRRPTGQDPAALFPPCPTRRSPHRLSGQPHARLL